jgi:antitoxin component YwqK of YwqJK toxin-antitoxin module
MRTIQRIEAASRTEKINSLLNQPVFNVTGCLKEYSMSNSDADKSLSEMRVSEDLLEYESDALVLNGKLFSGIGYANYPNGHLRREVTYVEGFPRGYCREWYENGQLSKEWYAEPGVAPSKITQWHENGQIKSICIREHGVELEYKEWGTDGELITERKIAEGTAMHKLLLRMRKIKSQI